MDNLNLDIRGVPAVLNTSLPPNTITFITGSGEVARISPDGVMRFTIEANDENAARFVECIEGLIKRRLTGIEVFEKHTL